MIIVNKADSAIRHLISKIAEEGVEVPSKYGNSIQSKPAFLVVKKPEYFNDMSDDFWYINGESYLDRVNRFLEVVALKIKASPYTRRMSIPIWYPKDHYSPTPPAITEVSFLYFNDKINLTAYLRSLNVLDYFTCDFDLLNYLLERVSTLSGIESGSIGLVIGIPHIYKRDLERAEKEYGSSKKKEFFGSSYEGTHIVEKSLASSWHSALNNVYRGMVKKTEWGTLFGKQDKCRFLPRVYIEVKKPDEDKIHDKAPFSKEYGIDYAHNYVIYAKYIDKPVSYIEKKEGEVYTYAERARYCEKDEIKVDQLYKCIEKLRKNIYSRDCYVSISRPWDLFSNEPPCLRGYHFIPNKKKLIGLFYMRSNDVYGAMHANMFAFSLLTAYVSELVGFEGYEYHHFTNDAHIYFESIKAVEDILFPETPKILDIFND